MPTVCLMNDEFVPTPLQKRILEALKGRALHTEDLVREVGDPPRFFSGQGGFWELRHWGLVVHDARLGNYRPDSPPREAAMASRPHARPIPVPPPARRVDLRVLRQDRSHVRGGAHRPHLTV